MVDQYGVPQYGVPQYKELPQRNPEEKERERGMAFLVIHNNLFYLLYIDINYCVNHNMQRR